MQNYSIVKSGNIVFALLFSVSAFAQGTPVDQYRQMGSLAAIAEACYGSLAIPNKLNSTVQAAVHNNPGVTETIKSLLAEYNRSYKQAIIDRKIWNGSQQKFSTPFNCTQPSDVDMVKKFESAVLSNLK